MNRAARWAALMISDTTALKISTFFIIIHAQKLKQMVKEISRRYDGCVEVFTNFEQVFVATDNILAFRGNRAGQKFIIVRVFTNRFFERMRRNKLCLNENKFENQINIDALEFFRKGVNNPPIFFNNIFGYSDLNLIILPGFEDSVGGSTEKYPFKPELCLSV